MNRRFSKEVQIYKNPESIKSKFLKSHDSAVLLDNSHSTAFFLLKIDNKFKVKILIEIDEEYYPFRRPNVKINNINYLDYLVINTKFLKEITSEYKCLCCQSILCKWYAGYNFFHIFQEVINFFSIKLRILQRIYCKLITNQIIGTYVPIIEFI